MTPAAPTRPAPTADVRSLVRVRARTERLVSYRRSFWPWFTKEERRAVLWALFSCYRDFQRLERLGEWAALTGRGR